MNSMKDNSGKTNKSALASLNINIDGIADKNIREGILILFNLIEDLSSTVKKQQEEIQRLRDENNRLKGEQPKPKIKPPKGKGGSDNRDISSENERKDHNTQNSRNRESKVEKVKIDRTEICEVDRTILPEDAEFKGYDSVIVQDLKIVTDNVEFKKEIFYSPSLKKTYRGYLPLGYEGEYGPTVKALTVIMKYVCNTSEPKILEFFKNFNIYISASSISRMLTKNNDVFHKEKEELYLAGLESRLYQQIDDTGARVNGENYHTHIVCNELYAAFFTTKHKDRLTILDILRNFSARKYCINNETFRLLEELRVSKSIRECLKKIL